MLKLRNEQLKALASAATIDFHARLIRFVREELADEAATMDDRTLRGFVLDSVRRAGAHGIVTERAIASFVFVSILLGEPVDQVPQFRDGLAGARDRETFVEVLLSALT